MKNLLYFTRNEINEKAELFLSKFNVNSELPIPIDEIVELQLGIEIIPKINLEKRLSVDAFLSSDRQTIFIDNDQFINDARIYRYRFTLAHEIGHYVLHQNICKGFKSEKDFIEFYTTNRDIMGSYEWQADFFASLILVPSKEFIVWADIIKIKNKIKHLQNIHKEIKKDTIETLGLGSFAEDMRLKYSISSHSAKLRLQTYLQYGI